MCRARRENRSRVSVRVMSVRAASSNNTAEQKYDMLVSSMTYIAHNSLVFYSCIASTHKTRLGCHCWGTYSRNSPVLRKIPESLGTFPKSEYSRPIYRSLCLDHFDTPRHVPDLIRESELLRYINIHKLIIKLSS